MNPTDLTNALLYGIPVVLYAGMYGGFDTILTRRGRPIQSVPGAQGQGKQQGFAASSSFHIAVAKSQEQFAAASDLVRERYGWRGYNVLDPAGAFVGSGRGRASREITFLVASDRATLGTLTLGLDGPCGLSAEAAYGDVITRFRRKGHKVCELTRLALAEHADSRTVLASLFSLAHAVGRTIHDVTDAFIEVNPRHVAFYSRVLGFVAAGGETFCERVRAPSVLLQLELDALEQRLGLLDVAALMQPLAAHAA